MEFDTTSAIWLQLVAEFSRRIATGEWAGAARIPGVRELAAEFGVNPNTVQRALAELERDGLCRSERTTGRFVTEDQGRIKQLRESLASEVVDDFIRRVRGFEMELAEAVDLIENRWRKFDGNDGAGESVRKD